MQQEHLKWYSDILNLETQMLVYGHSGIPFLIFPTTLGGYNEAPDFYLVESVRHFVEAGKIKIYCVDGVNKHSWYNKEIPPKERVINHMWYDKFILQEIVGNVIKDSPTGKIGVAGCSFGGYTATNFAFKYPSLVGYLISMSGSYDIRSFLDGYYDQNVYFNNPVDYIGDLTDKNIWDMGIILGTSDWDICQEANFEMSGLLHQKGIKHWLDVVSESQHDWPLWRYMFPKYLQAIKY